MTTSDEEPPDRRRGRRGWRGFVAVVAREAAIEVVVLATLIVVVWLAIG